MLGGLPWAAVWPGVERDLRRIVCRRLPGDVEVDDVVQEVFLRLLAAHTPLRTADDLLRYATKTACNYVTDLHRRGHRAATAVGLGEPTSEDVERSVLNRLRFEALASGVADLSDQDRAAFADPGGDPARTTGAMKVRRSRVRARLRAQVKKAIGGGFVVPRLRWLLVPAAAAGIVVPSPLPLLEPFAPRSPKATVQLPEEHVARVSAPARALEGSYAPAVAPVVRVVPQRPVDEKARGTYNPDVVVQGPNGLGGDTGTGEPPRDGPPPLVCVMRVLPSGDLCVEHPLRG